MELLTLIGIGVMALAAVSSVLLLLVGKARRKRLDSVLYEEYGEYGCHLRR